MILNSVPNTDLSPASAASLRSLVSEELVDVARFVFALQQVLPPPSESKFKCGVARPIFLHFDEIGELDRPRVVAKHELNKSAREMFYSFWFHLDRTIKLANCFVYLSGKNSQIEVIGHQQSDRSVGLVERLYLEPLTSDHIMRVLAKPLPVGDLRGIPMCKAVFAVDPGNLHDHRSKELFSRLADLVIRVTSGLPRAIDYAFGWFRNSLNSLDQLGAFLEDGVQVTILILSLPRFCLHLTIVIAGRVCTPGPPSASSRIPSGRLFTTLGPLSECAARPRGSRTDWACLQTQRVLLLRE